MGHHICISTTMVYRICLVLVAMALYSTEASYGYGGSGKAFIIPGTEPRAMPGSYNQKYMQPVFTHHVQHASPVQYVAVAPISGYPYAPALSGHGYSAADSVSHGHVVAPVVNHGHTAAHVSHGHTADYVSHGHTVAPVVNHGHTAAHVSHGHTVAPVVSQGHNVAPVISHGFSSVLPAREISTSNYIPSHGHTTYY